MYLEPNFDECVSCVKIAAVEIGYDGMCKLTPISPGFSGVPLRTVPRISACRAGRISWGREIWGEAEIQCSSNCTSGWWPNYAGPTSNWNTSHSRSIKILWVINCGWLCSNRHWKRVLGKDGSLSWKIVRIDSKYRNVLLLELHKRRDLILGTFRTTGKVFYLQNARIQLIGEKVCTSWCISLLGNKLPETDKLVGMTSESMSGRENFFMYSKNCQFWRRKKWNILWARVRSKCCRNLKDRKNLSVSQNER